MLHDIGSAINVEDTKSNEIRYTTSPKYNTMWSKDIKINFFNNSKNM